MEAMKAENTILSLNEDCVLKIYQFLNDEDSISLAESDGRLADFGYHRFQKCSSFKIDWSMLDKGEVYIGCIIKHIGEHVKFLDIRCFGFNRSMRAQLSELINGCTNLKSLTINDGNNDKIQIDLSSHNFDSVETLNLFNSDLNVENSFLKNFRNIRVLYISRCDIKQDDLKTILKNNPDIECLYVQTYGYGDECEFDYQLIELIPKIQKLYLDKGKDLSKLSSFLKLYQLTELQLDFCENDVNNVLRKLPRKQIMKKMELVRCRVNDDFFETLLLFEEMEVLVVFSYKLVTLMPSTTWPKKLKSLYLKHFKFTHYIFMSLIEQLKFLKKIDVGRCRINESGDFLHLFEQIFNKIHQNQRLRMVLFGNVECSRASICKRFMSKKMRIIVIRGFREDPLRIGIRYRH